MIDIDSYAYSNNLKKVHPGEKFLFAVLTMAVCLTSPTVITPLIVLALMGGGVIIKAGIPARVFFKLMLVPLSFLLLSVLTIAFSVSTNPSGFWLAQTIHGLTIGIHYPDLMTAVHLFLRSLGAVSCLYFLALTTPMTAIITVLHRFESPLHYYGIDATDLSVYLCLNGNSHHHQTSTIFTLRICIVENLLSFSKSAFFCTVRESLCEVSRTLQCHGS